MKWQKQYCYHPGLTFLQIDDTHPQKNSPVGIALGSKNKLSNAAPS
jgi:hypothetical protein